MSVERVDLKLGFACNNRCHFCVQGDKRSKFGPKSADQIKASLEEGRQKGAKSLVLTGGEPTVHKSLIGTIRLARDLGYEIIQIQSNGRRFFYEDFCRELIDAGANEFSPALHGSTPEIHDELTRVPGAFVQVIGGIRNLRKLGQRILTNTVITERNYKDLPNIARLLVSLGVNQYQFAFVHILGEADKNKNKIVPKKSEIMPYVFKGLDIGIKSGVCSMTEAIPYCLMKGYEDYVAEKIIPHTAVYDAEAVISDYTAYRHDEGKAKTDKCRNCRYDFVCEGPWKEYPELFGWDEFVPVRN